MGLLTVRHLTVYRYSEPVELGEHRMMFRPRASHDLRLLRTSLDIIPRPATLRWLHDVFDNSVAVTTFEGAVSELSFESRVTLEHFETASPEYAIEEYAKVYPFAYSNEDFLNLSRALFRPFASDHVNRWALQFLDPARTTGTMSLLRAMTAGIRDQFHYVRRGEKGVQSPDDTLQSRRGSCRDFAVLMMEAVRSLGLAARFVSGYIFTPGDDSAGARGTTGGGSTHAWVQVYLPGAGWIDFDPTNSIVGNRNLIRVAVAWSPEQVLPLWGTFIGSPSSFLDMEVTVSVTGGGMES
ncbi:MAG TPA: transglutaminase family protein [Bryobacteraceae bacterium]|jgi:transglutaminase-like putative cysteine protease